MDPEELELLAGTLRATMTSAASGAALDAALADLGWADMLAEWPEVAIPLVFRLLGETGTHAPVINDVVGTTCLPYAGGAWVAWHRDDVPGAVPGAVSGSAMELPLRRVPGPALLSPAALAAGRRAVGWWLLGSGRAMLSLARQHALDRVQFGRPIAAFQAVRHKLADTLVALDGAEAVLAAAGEAAPGSEEDDLGALLAKAAAGQASLLAARHCQQVLAGVGFTAEHGLHHHVKRVLVLDGLLGSTRELTREAGRRVVAAGAAPRLVDL
ncbi:MAG TPA: acyl-CoA dehydrogenase family protein [Trebonia sp.]|nr:acyl-CoA dehydrogenase family protein [Trebonia sp.]